MNMKDHGLPIAAVTQMTGIAGHTLRKWESRYALVTPERTSTGRRLYTQDNIEKLILVRELTSRGHQVRLLADLSTGELEALLSKCNKGESIGAAKRVLAIGHVVAATLRVSKANFPAELSLISTDATEWLSKSTLNDSYDMVIIEVPTLGQQVAKLLADLSRDCRLVLIYGFASRGDIQGLRDKGVECLRAPVEATELLRIVGASDVKETIAEPQENLSKVPSRRLPDDVIARVSNILPSIQCECPNHIASLLYDLIAFERYCQQCETEQAKDADLHVYLGNITGLARASFEEALERVASEEGIPLESIV
ncbi:MAG: MerR family transcriptional regulator [Candidatus Azotimanducaceae bacterium]|uniref:MerR family transcriptional regulator n=1 Tax=OM182 bacterium TaxID=2510334 RepID=A0A520S3D0_9GAMM|nr:hypothetical protein [Gammaproteobacteria bacterium]RZO76987.1 MAG: MerR family transcriptional regulator [OM182 bacterium]